MSMYAHRKNIVDMENIIQSLNRNPRNTEDLRSNTEENCQPCYKKHIKLLARRWIELKKFMEIVRKNDRHIQRI